MRKRKTESLGANTATFDQAIAALWESDDERNKAYSQASASDRKVLSIAVFDDAQDFLDICKEVVAEINKKGRRIDLFVHRPLSAEEIARTIYEQHLLRRTHDIVVIDYEFTDSGTAFHADEVLKEIDKYAVSKGAACELASQTSSDDPGFGRFRPRYLPRVVVTRLDYQYSITEKLARAGADHTYFGKGQDKPGAHNSSAKGTARLFETLLRADELDDLRLRASQRLWRDLMVAMEKKTEEADDIVLDTPEDAGKRISGLVSWIRQWLLDAGFANHVHFRIAKRDEEGRLMLENIGQCHPQSPQVVRWNQVPMLKRIAESKIDHSEFAPLYTRWLSHKDLKHPGLEWLREGMGNHAMGTPLICRHGFFGTFTLTRQRTIGWPAELDPETDRERDTDPNRFSALDSQNLIRVAQRLSLYYSQMLDQSLLRRREKGLLKLAEQISPQDDRDRIIQTAIHFIHGEFHEGHELAYQVDDYEQAPRKWGRVTCRLLEPASGLIYRMDGWGEGYETEQPIQCGLKKGGVQTYLQLKDVDKSMYAISIANAVDLYRHSDLDDVPYTQTTTVRMEAAMVVRLEVNEVVLGAINVEHRRAGFYGPRPKDVEGPVTGNDSLDLLKAVARVVAQALHSLQRHYFERALVRLAQIAEEDEAKVMDSLAETLYAYAGLGVLLWSEPGPDGKLIVKQGWRAMEVNEAQTALVRDKSPLIRMSNKEIQLWDHRAEDGFFIDHTLTEYRLGGPLFEYSEVPGTINSEEDTTLRNFPTAAQFNLAMVDHSQQASTPRIQAIGVLALLFRRKPALSREQQQLLADFGGFVGAYLASARRDRLFFSAEKQRTVTNFLLGQSHQAQHALKSKVNYLADQLKLAVHGMETLEPMDPVHLLPRVRAWQAELSAVRLLPRDITLRPDISIADCWAVATAKLEPKIVSNHAQVLPLVDDVRCTTDAVVLREVFFILIDNALDVFRTTDKTIPVEGWRIEIEKVASNNGAAVRIRDNGSGVPEDARSRWGELGSSNKGSSGSGIYWSQMMLKLVGGMLYLRESDETGTAIDVILGELG